MAISPGVYTYRELLDLAGVDFNEQATVDYGNGDQLDYRRVNVGGLTFDDLDSVIIVPDTNDKLEIRTEGEVVGTLEVDTSQPHRTGVEVADNAVFPRQPPPSN